MTCYDNFSNEKSKVLSLLERNYDGKYTLCSKTVRDNWRKFDSFGSAFSYDKSTGDFVSDAVLANSQ